MISLNIVPLTLRLIVIWHCFTGSVDAWLFSRSEPLIAENEPCDPLDQAWRPYPADQTKFLYCEVFFRKYLIGTCQALNGVSKYFDASKQQCVENDVHTSQSLRSSTPSIIEKRVGESCSVNKDCSDGMYCNSGVCACFLNYIEVNLKCIRVSSICTSSHFYAEQSSGKPRTCVLDVHCPSGFSCDPHPGAPDTSFCCHKSGDKNVCGTTKAYTQNSKEVSCSPELAHCPSGYSCQYNSNLNRHFCCQLTVTEWYTPSSSVFTTSSLLVTNASLPTPVVSALEEVRGQTIALAESVCGIGSAPWLYENYPMPCNPNPPSNCPPTYVCKSRPGSKLYFCCNDAKSTSSSVQSTISLSSVFSTVSTTTAVPGNKYTSICLSSAPFLLNGQPLMCIGSDPKSCPDGYICEQQNMQPKFHWSDQQPLGNLSFCCSVFASSSTSSPRPTALYQARPTPQPNKTVCPGNGEPFQIQDKPVMCIRTDPQSCPIPYSCQYHDASRVHFCCTNNTATSSGFSSSSISSSPSITSSGSTSILPSGSTSSSGSTSFLPSSPVPSTLKFEPDGCPPQTVSTVDHEGRVVTCSLTNTSQGCPAGFNCLYTELHSRYQCCGFRSTSTFSSSSTSQTVSTSGSFTTSPSVVAAAIDDGCPSGQRAYKDPATSQPISCVANQLDSCPGGYFCQFSAHSNKFQCCGVHAGCPRDSIAYISVITGAVQYCNFDDKACPPGYRCEKGHEQQKVCCSSRRSIEPQSYPEVKVCPVGSPLSADDKIIACSDMNLCPFGYSCLPSTKGPACCPDPQTVCTQSVSLGKQCSKGDLASQKGSRYYFNTEKGVCQSFQYDGCSGNANNFESMQECSAFCLQGLCPRGLPARFDTNTPLRCSNAKQDCPPDYTCTAAAFGPQGAHVCCPKPDLICTLLMHEGQKCEESGKSQPIIRFFYDSHRGNCQPFSYHGCGGNANNFISINQCQSFCGGFTTTEISTSPLTKISSFPSSLLAFLATVPVVGTTTAASTTTISGMSTNSGILTSQFCPVAGEFLPTDPLYHSCNPLVPYSCPHGYTCQNSTKKAGFICCGSPTLHIKGPTCPTGNDVYIHPATRQPHVCTLDKNGCPDKYICIFSDPLREYFCCSSNSGITFAPKIDTCAEGDPFFYPGTFQPLSCRPGTVCPKGFECKRASQSEEFICCAAGQKLIELSDRTRDNGPRYYPRPNRQQIFQANNWYPLQGGAQTWNNGLADNNYLTQRATQFRPVPSWSSLNQIAKPLSTSKVTGDQTYCNKSEAKELGAECCAHEQCTYNFCSEFKNTKYCACPRHLLLDLTYDTSRCVNSCSKWREGAFCVSTPPDVPLNLIRLRFGTRLTNKKRLS